MKRGILILLFSSLLLCSLMSCGSTGENVPAETDAAKTNETVTETEEPALKEPDIPELDYGGAEFTYLIRDTSANSYMEKWVFSEGEDGDPVNDAVFRRNTQIEDRFHIKLKTISPKYTGGWSGELENLAREYIMANDSGIDVISNCRSMLANLMREGYLYDMRTLNYVNLTAPYWDKNASETLDIKGKLYLMPNDISMGNLSMATYTYFNQSIIDDYDLDDPYELVESNQWTIDKMLEMTAAISVDVNGDSVFDKEDVYGMLTEESTNGTFINLAAGSGISMAVKDKDGNIVPNIMTEKVQQLIDKCSAVFMNTDCAVSSEELQAGADLSGYTNTYNYPRDLFAQDHFLFYISGISSMSRFGDMKHDFGLIPNPKYDASQEGYFHRVDLNALIFAVPVCAGDMERVGAVLEYSAWLSHQTVLPAYYETTIKGKKLRDEKAYEMLDLIKSSILYDFTEIYGFSGTQILYDGYKTGNLASTYAKGEKNFLKQISKFVESMDAID